MPARSWLRLLGSLVLLMGVPLGAGAQEWTRFRGPNGSGISDDASVPTSWTEDDFLFQVELPGEGHSAPVIWGDRLFLTSSQDDGAQRNVLCLSTHDGSVQWSKEYAATSHGKHNFNSFASPTAALDEQRVYVVWSSPDDYHIRALTHDGAEVWDRSLGPFESQHSCGTSPIVYEDLILLGNDQDGASFLIALDRATGEIVWQVPRETDRVAYSTPCIYHPPGGADEVIFNSGAHGITSLDPLTGRKNWELQVFDKRSVSSPVVAGDLIIGSCGSGAGGNFVVAVRPGRPEANVEPELAYKITKSAPYTPTSLYKDGLLYMWSEQGVITCADAATGNPLWQKRVSGRFFGSPVCIADRLYCISDKGEVPVVSADSAEFRVLARNALPEGSHSTPAVANGTLYLRTFSHLYAVKGQ